MNYSLNKLCFYINILLVLFLLYTISYNPIIEGITGSRMNCCGGIEPGVHYQESDTDPPDYIKRCFRSERDTSDNSYYYPGWNGFPCTSKDSNGCCEGEGECIATVKGGYCSSDNGNFIFQRNGNRNTYIKRTNDEEIDINNSSDMEDYFYDRSKHSSLSHLSPEMRQFMARRDATKEYMIEKRRNKMLLQSEDRKNILDILRQKRKYNHLYRAFLIIHVSIIIIFAFILKDKITTKIQYYLNVITGQYYKFSGKIN